MEIDERATVCRTVSWRGGHVLDAPVVRDFELVLALSAPGGSSGRCEAEQGLQRFAGLMGVRLGHRMLWHPADQAQLAEPVSWPPGVVGPRLPLQAWSGRPDLTAIAGWIAGELSADLGRSGSQALIAAVELRDGRGGSAVVHGEQAARWQGIGGPLHRPSPPGIDQPRPVEPLSGIETCSSKG